MKEDKITGDDLKYVTRNELKSWGVDSLKHRAQIEKHIQLLCQTNTDNGNN